ncbi:MAG: hypothetical protein AB7S54_12295, partial [Bacteroidales bacterium]
MFFTKFCLLFGPLFGLLGKANPLGLLLYSLLLDPLLLGNPLGLLLGLYPCLLGYLLAGLGLLPERFIQELGLGQGSLPGL